MNEEEAIKKSDYNSAQYAIDRVNDIKNDLHFAKVTKKFSVWCDLLFNYLSEVNPQMSEEEEKEFKDKLRKVRRSITRPSRGLVDADEQNIYDKLYDVELALERFWDSKGNKFLYSERQREFESDESGVSEILRQNKQRQQLLQQAIDRLGINEGESNEAQPRKEQE